MKGREAGRKTGGILADVSSLLFLLFAILRSF